MTDIEYSIPVGTQIKTCECGAKTCIVAATSDEEARLVTVEWCGGKNFDYWGAEHSCNGRICAPEEVSKSQVEPFKRVEKGELTAVWCKGANCGKIIYFRKTESGASTPVNADGSPHWATCHDEKEFKQKQKAASSTRNVSTQQPAPLSLWNGENESPGEQIESRKMRSR